MRTRESAQDEETKQHLFEPFFATNGSEEGTGLGLSVVYGIVTQHEGWIEVHSEVGEGSSFKVYLPAFSGEGESEVQEPISMQALQGSGEAILLVEDDESVRGVAARMLGAGLRGA